MKKLLFLLLLVAQAGWGAIAKVSVQPLGVTHTTAGTSCANVATASWGTSTTQSVFIVITFASTAPTVTFSDNATGGSNTYTSLTNDNANGGHVVIGYSLNIPRVNSSGLVVTGTWSGTQRNSCVFVAYTGVVSAGVTNSADSPSANNTPTATTTTTSANSWMVAGMADDTGTLTWSTGTGNLRTSIAGGGSTTPGAAIVDNTSASQGAGVVTSATLSASTKNWAVAVVELRSDLILPIVTPNGGSASSFSVTLSSGDTSPTFCYTTNGTTPAATTPGTCSTGTTYSGAFNITTGPTTVKALSTKSGWTNSGVTTSNTFNIVTCTTYRTTTGAGC